MDELCRFAGTSKSTLLRAFARAKGVTPYRYLKTVRVNEARELLRKGVPPADAACLTGFSDQSHLTNCFRSFIGFSPAVMLFAKGSGISRRGGERRGG